MDHIRTLDGEVWGGGGRRGYNEETSQAIPCPEASKAHNRSFQSINTKPEGKPASYIKNNSQ